MGNEVCIMDKVDLVGADVLAQARAQMKKFNALNVSVPKIEVKGEWMLEGLTFPLEDWCNAFPPLGHRFINVNTSGDRKPKMEATEGSFMRLYFVFSGTELDADSELATGDLFAK